MSEGQSPRGKTVESRENDCIALAMDLAEQHLREGTATSQEITHFLRMGSTKERLEKEVLENKCALLQAQVDSLKAQERTEELYAKAIRAMQSYQPSRDEYDDDDEDYDDDDEEYE